MRDFKFFNTVAEERARLLREFLGDEQDEDAIEPIGQYQTETTQIYTEMVRINIPLNEMTEDHLNRIKLHSEQELIERFTNTLDIRHEIIYQDENGFTMRSELFL